jgi:hypothetical protein
MENIPKSRRKMEERGKIDTANTLKYDCFFIWLGTDTSLIYDCSFIWLGTDTSLIYDCSFIWLGTDTSLIYDCSLSGLVQILH